MYSRFLQLILHSTALRLVIGFAICFPIVFVVSFSFHNIVAYLTDRSVYFDYANTTCRRDDGTLQVRAVEYVGMARGANGSIGIEFASCSWFKRALPVDFHDRLFCSHDGKEYTLVSWQDESLPAAKVGKEYKRKRWVYAKEFYTDKTCYIDSNVTMHESLVTKEQRMVSEVFIPKGKG